MRLIHTSEMPDKYGTNKDHDFRYPTKRQVSSLLNNKSFIHDLDADTYVRCEQAADEDYLRFGTAGVERITVNNANSIGMGNLTPDSNGLEINRTENTVYDASLASHQRANGATLLVQNESVVVNSFAQLVLRNRAAGVGGCRFVSVENGVNSSDLAIITGDTGEKVRIDNAGNVGILTPIPAARLQVIGDVRLGAAANYSEFEADGTLVFNGDATVWDDLFFPMSSGKVGGVNQPTWAAFQGNIYEYTFGVNDYIHLPSGEIIHKYLEGSNIELHCHIVTNGSDIADRDVNYEIEYTIGDTNEVMSAAVVITSGDYTIPGGTADRTHLYVDMGNIAGAGYRIGAAIKMRFRRIALVGGGVAPTSEPFVMMVGAHIEMDTVGSRTETAK